MKKFERQLQIRWSDLDPNFHLRHSVYYDWGAMCRVDFLEEHGLTGAVMQNLRFGPILFREECIFRKEILLGDAVHIELELINARKDYSRWSIRHGIYKDREILAASLTVEGAWINMDMRKLATPPETIFSVFEQMPKSAEFKLL